MKIAKEHAAKFIKFYYDCSGVMLQEEDVFACLVDVFAEVTKVEKLELTEESIRKMIDDYLTSLKMQETSPCTEYPYWPKDPYWPKYPQSGVYAYMASFSPLDQKLDQTYGTGSNADPSSLYDKAGLDQIQPRYGVPFKKDAGFNNPDKKD